MNILRVLYETFKNFINAEMTSNYHNYIDRTINDSRNVYNSSKYLRQVYILQGSQKYKQVIVSNISKFQYSMRSFSIINSQYMFKIINKVINTFYV